MDQAPDQLPIEGLQPAPSSGKTTVKELEDIRAQAAEGGLKAARPERESRPPSEAATDQGHGRRPDIRTVRREHMADVREESTQRSAESRTTQEKADFDAWQEREAERARETMRLLDETKPDAEPESS